MMGSGNFKKIPNRSVGASRGMTLIEVAISLAILGVITAATVDLYNRAQYQQKVETTSQNMDAIVQALSLYAETAGRVPCPANPSASDVTFGWEYNVTTAMLAVTATHFPVGSCGTLGSTSGGLAAPTEGILPFATLGLPAATARDGWGHYFTYAVSPVFARSNDQATAISDTGTIHGRCRSDGWVDKNDLYNRNAVKARFCCADQAAPIYDEATDLVMKFALDNTVLSPVRTVGTQLTTGVAPYNSVNTPTAVYNSINVTTTKTSGTTGVPTMDMSPIEAPAIVLISHGPNGYGAYLGNNTLSRSSVPSGYTLEAKNVHTTTSNVYYDGPIQLASGATYYDNIVRWFTQDGLIAAHGALSCSYP